MATEISEIKRAVPLPRRHKVDFKGNVMAALAARQITYHVRATPHHPSTEIAEEIYEMPPAASTTSNDSRRRRARRRRHLYAPAGAGARLSRDQRQRLLTRWSTPLQAAPLTHGAQRVRARERSAGHPRRSLDEVHARHRWISAGARPAAVYDMKPHGDPRGGAP